VSVLEKPGIRVTVELRSRDIDRLGHVNQSVYHDLLVEARRRLFGSLRTEERAFVMVHVELSFRHEIRLDADRVEVTAYVVEVGGKSFTIAQEIFLPDGTVAADGRAVLVAWDIARRCSRPLELHERQRLTRSPSGMGAGVAASRVTGLAADRDEVATLVDTGVQHFGLAD
jgi:acyl-CoA thioester hydrolase